MNEFDNSLKCYLNQHCVICIGCNSTDIIVDDWEGFVDFLYAKNYRVLSILWWEYIKISEQGDMSLGGGGPLDPNNVEFMWSETIIGQEFSDISTAFEIKAYIVQVKQKYRLHNIVPSFTIAMSSIN